jgi:hypothetical protein
MQQLAASSWNFQVTTAQTFPVEYSRSCTSKI